MLQRIQTVFMIIASIAMLLVLFFPIWEKSDANPENTEREYAILNAFELRYEGHNTATGEVKLLGTQHTFPISIAAVLSAAVMIFSITRYKKRILQVKLNALFSLLAAATLMSAYYFIHKANGLFDDQMPGAFLVGFYLPVVGLLNNMIANRFIRKDEKLVRSADRLR